MIYLIRHAESEYNIAEKKISQKYDGNYFEEKEYLDLKFDLNYEDCSITQHGKQQCVGCRQKMKDIDVDLIIVSPMRRALMTCYQTFKNHKSKCPVIVDPDFRQILESGCDIASRLGQSMKDFHEYDYSLISDCDTWYINAIIDNEIKKDLLSKLEGSENKREDAMKVSVQFLKDMWEKRKQNPELKKKVLSCIQTQKNKLKQLLKTYKSIAIVSHSENIKSYVGYKIPNCSVFKYHSQNLEKPASEIQKNEIE